MLSGGSVLRSAEPSCLRRNCPQVNVSGQLPPHRSRTMPHSDAGRPPACDLHNCAAQYSKGEVRRAGAMQGSHDIGGSAMGVGIGQVRLDSKVG